MTPLGVVAYAALGLVLGVFVIWVVFPFLFLLFAPRGRQGEKSWSVGGKKSFVCWSLKWSKEVVGQLRGEAEQELKDG